MVAEQTEATVPARVLDFLDKASDAALDQVLEFPGEAGR
jgi:hypothetical protein